jgi:AraC family transcriptional activator of pobA
MKNEQIPILSPIDLDKHHFGITTMHPEFSPFYNIFHINRLETYRDKILFPLPPHRKTVYDFIVLTKGSSTRSKGLNNYTFKANTIFFLPAYQITTHESMSKNAEGFFCHFDIDIFNTYFPAYKHFIQFPFLQFSGEPVVTIDKNGMEAIINILSRLEAEYNSKHIDRFDLVATYLLAIFFEVNRFIKPAAGVKKNAALAITQHYKNALSKHIYENQRVTDYAKLLAVTSNHLNKCVKSITGKSAQDLLNEMLLLEAKVLLKQTDLQISEIAYKLTEQNPGDFGRFFKSKTGMTPSQYRQMIDFAY